MLAKRPKIFRNMDEETQTDIGEENNKELKNKTEVDDTEKDNVQEKLFNSHGIPIDEHKIMCCEIHPDKIVEYYCRIHGALPCSRCAIENHRKCQGMVIIEDVAQSAKAKGEVVKVSQKLDTAAAQIEAQRQSDKKVLTNLDESIENINKELKHHRDKICTIAESIETRLTKRSRKIYKERSGFVTGHLDTCNIVGVQVERLRQVMERIMASENEAEKFVMLQKVKKTLPFLNTPLHNLQRDAIDVQMYLTLNVDLDKTLEHIDKRMLIEVKTSKRGDVGPKQSSVKDKKSILKSQLNLYESKSNKSSSTNKVNPHKFLAQRNFKPYKVRPYTVEKKPAVKTPFKSFGSLASVRNTRPVIVLSGENISSPSQINKASTASRNIANKPVKGHETPDTLADRKVIEVEVTRHNKNADGQAKSSKYTWGAQADKQPAGGVKSVHTTSTNTVPSKSTRYSAKNYKFVLPSYDKKLGLETSSEQNKSNDSPTGLSKGRRPLYRKEKMANEQTDDQYKNKNISDRSKQDRRKIIPSPHRMHPKSKVVFADTGAPGKSSDREVETHSTVKDANSNPNGTTIHVKVNMSNNGIVQENQGTDNSQKRNGTVSPIKNNVHSNASSNNVIADNKNNPKVPNGDLSNGRPKSKTPEKQTDIGLNKKNFEDTTHGTKVKKSEENQNQIPSTVHPDKNKNDVDLISKKADSNGNQNKTTNQPSQLDENVKYESHKNEKNQTAENPANKDSVNGETVMKEKSKEELSQIQSNDNRNVSTSSPNDNQAHSESNVKASNVKDDKNNPVKAFVTDISTISEGPTISEKSIERLIKSRSADRLRVRKSGSSLLRAKSDK